MKKLISTLTLAVVMMFGATFSYAGIIISDNHEAACNSGIIVFGNSGIIVFGVTIGENPCSSLGNGGIIISD